MPFLILVALLGAPAELSSKAKALNREGMRLAEAGEFEEAITRFKAAEALEPRPQYHCNIGIAYQQWQKWDLSLRYLESCQSRGGDVAAQLKQVEAKLRSGGFGALRLKLPLGRVRFGPRDEQWLIDASRVFWFPVGQVVVVEVVLADGRNWVQQAEPRRGEIVDVELFPPFAPPVPDAGVNTQPDPVDAGLGEPTDAGTNDQPKTTASPSASLDGGLLLERPSPLPTPAEARPAAWPFFVGAAAGALAGLGCWLGASALGRSTTASTTEAELGPYRALLVTSFSLWALSGAALVVGGVVLFGAPGAATPSAAVVTATGTF